MIEKGHTMANRRRHKRVSLLKEIDVSFSNNKPDNKVDARGLVINISRSGMVLYCDHPINPGNDIIVKLPFVDEYKVDRIEIVVGDIRWAKPLENFFAIGIQFNPLNEHDHFMLLAYLNYAEGFEKPYINE